jgi:hypothetical protein
MAWKLSDAVSSADVESDTEMCCVCGGEAGEVGGAEHCEECGDSACEDCIHDGLCENCDESI